MYGTLLREIQLQLLSGLKRGSQGIWFPTLNGFGCIDIGNASNFLEPF